MFSFSDEVLNFANKEIVNISSLVRISLKFSEMFVIEPAVGENIAWELFSSSSFSFTITKWLHFEYARFGDVLDSRYLALKLRSPGGSFLVSSHNAIH